MVIGRVKAKIRRDGWTGLLRSAKMGVFYRLEQAMLHHAPSLVSLGFRKPRFLYLELTNNCNLNCQECFRGGRPLGFMSFHLFQRLVDEAAEIGGVSLLFHLGGESTLHPDLPYFLDYATDLKHKFYKMSLTTNGTRFNGDVAEAALKLDWVTFSVDGVGSVNERIRRGSNYAVIKRNIEHFITLRGESEKPIISINTVISNQTDSELDAIRREWNPKRLHVNFSGCINDHFKPLIQERYCKYCNHWIKAHTKPVCIYPFDRVLVTWNGDLHYCCHNLTGMLPAGCYPNQSLMEFWHSKRISDTRNALINHEKPVREVCGVCEKF